MPVTFNNAFFDNLSRSPEVAALVDSITEEVAEVARATAPESSGDYKGGIATASKLQERYVGLVVATDPKSMLVESLTGNLARALRTVMKRRRRG